MTKKRKAPPEPGQPEQKPPVKEPKKEPKIKEPGKGEPTKLSTKYEVRRELTIDNQ